MTHAEHPNALSPRRTLVLGSVICALPFVVQYAFYDGGFYYDDGFHLEQCELISQGKIALSDYVFLAHGEHLIPVWKTMFYGCWATFGESSGAFHFFVTLFHVASACVLFLIIRHYASDICAMVTTVLWAGAAVGGWDGPFLWIAASHLSIGVTFFLTAMYCLTRFQTAGEFRWSLAMMTCLTASLLTMGSLIVLTPALLLQYWLFEHQGVIRRKQQFRWLACWAAPCCVVVLAHLVWVLPAMQKLDRPPMNLFAGVQMLGGGYAASSWNLIIGFGDAVTLGRIAGAAWIVLLVLKADSSIRRLALLFFVLSFFFSVLAYMARSGWQVSHVLMWGRYRYLPTLFWCVVLGGVIEQGIAWLRQQKQQLLPVAAAVLLTTFVISQCRIASDAAAVFRQIASEALHANTAINPSQAALNNFGTADRRRFHSAFAASNERYGDGDSKAGQVEAVRLTAKAASAGPVVQRS